MTITSWFSDCDINIDIVLSLQQCV